MYKPSSNQQQLNCFVFLAMNVCFCYLFVVLVLSALSLRQKPSKYFNKTYIWSLLPYHILVSCLPKLANLQWSQPKMTFGGTRDMPAWSTRLFLCFLPHIFFGSSLNVNNIKPTLWNTPLTFIFLGSSLDSG